MATIPGPRGYSDAAILAKTGKCSAEWYAILDAWDGPAQGHTKMARHLASAYGLPGWWAQMVTVRYEWERGLRREAVVPADLQTALAADPAAAARFERLTEGHRREYVEWIDEARRPETRARRIAVTIERLAAASADARSAGPR